MTASTHDPCVCVQNRQRKSGSDKSKKMESPDGGVCDFSHTAILPVLLFCCCFVVSQSASSSRDETAQSTSSLLALLRWS